MKITRGLAIVLVLLIAQVVPAFAEKVTLACSQGEGRVTIYYTFDMKSRVGNEWWCSSLHAGTDSILGRL
jgi:hypothetical protein